MKKEVDGRGLACPKPVILTKKELDSIEEGVVSTIVDNEVAKENVSKLAQSLGYDFQVKQSEDESYYYIDIYKGQVELDGEVDKDKDLKDMVIAITADTMGKGNEELGKILIKSFVYTVSETPPYPKTMVFYNGGVRLTCQGSPVLDDLIRLEDKGVEIISCGTCLDFLELKDKLKVGSISNMYTIYEKLREPKNNLIIG
ncbi:MAG: sulfurtransferase-like selenium metabolism protein YedF [Tissierellaceae bacterium]|jgi:selenium metabolism protein YedF|nr:sulfurtransferase-like selenium metabolism protein YedF [Tissierellia bacterium]